MDLVGVERLRGRDIATGIVLGFATGLAALFLYLDATKNATTGVSQQILFGSIFTLDPTTIPLVVVMSVITLGVLTLIYRPLLLSSISRDLAAARGIRVRVVGVLFMLTLAVAVGLSSIAIGSVLSTALLIGPAATALRVTRNLRAALVVASVLGVVATWLGIVLAYDSFYWFPSSQGLPVSFFIVALIFLSYLLSGLPALRRRTSSPVAGEPTRERVGAVV
jgi:zinc/manganese transport system permease protein